MIEIENIIKTYGEINAIDDVSFSIPAGQFTVLLGPSGSGKTTMLRCLNRMATPTSGRILFDGRDVATQNVEDLRRRMGYVIQNIGLFPNMTVQKNIATVPRLLGWKHDRIKARVAEMLTLVGLDPERYAGKLPSQLSGGEAQRVGVARALAADPPVLLMDEPFGAVDPITRTRLQVEMKRLHNQLSTTIVFVTHDIDEAILLADKIALFRSGKLEQYDTPEGLWAHPANEFVRDFFGDDLGLRIMTRREVRTAALAPIGDSAALPTIQASASLKDALAVLIDQRAEAVLVVDADRPAGVLTFPALIDALAQVG